LLLGSAASNNQKVQIASLKNDVIPLLLKNIDNEFTFSVCTYIKFYFTNINVLLNLCSGSKKLYLCFIINYTTISLGAKTINR